MERFSRGGDSSYCDQDIEERCSVVMNKYFVGFVLQEDLLAV